MITLDDLLEDNMTNQGVYVPHNEIPQPEPETMPESYEELTELKNFIELSLRDIYAVGAMYSEQPEVAVVKDAARYEAVKLLNSLASRLKINLKYE